MSDKMWAQRLVAPYRFEKTTVGRPDPASLDLGQVLLRVLVGGICGSDLPFFKGNLFPFGGSEGEGFLSPAGVPLHEVVGEVVASRDDSVGPGARVVGWIDQSRGLAEYAVTDSGNVYVYDPDLTPEQAIMLQPLACVLNAVRNLDGIEGRRAAVIGQGPIGLLFSHVLKHFGAAHVTGVDKVDRMGVAELFRVDEMVHASSDRWAKASQEDGSAPSVVIEAVGHQVSTISHAVEALAPGGQIFYFGIPDDEIYPFPMNRFLRKNATLLAGATPPERRYPSLQQANSYLSIYPELARSYVTHTFSVDDATDAYMLATRPVPGQLKIALTA